METRVLYAFKKKTKINNKQIVGAKSTKQYKTLSLSLSVICV